jgi:midasin
VKDADTAMEEVESANGEDMDSDGDQDAQAEQTSQAAEEDGSDVGGEDTNEGLEVDDGGEDVDEEENAQLQTQDKSKSAEENIFSENKGAGLDADDQPDQTTSAGASKQNQGTAKEDESNETSASGEKGTNGESNVMDAVGRSDEAQESSDAQPFKKLGDILEQWYNQHRPVRPGTEDNPDASRQENRDVDMADVDFEHLLNETTQADAQALGAATEDQAKGHDNENAIPTNEEILQTFAEETDPPDEEDSAMPDVQNSVQGKPELDTSRPNAFIGDQKPAKKLEDVSDTMDADSESDVEDVDAHLSSIQITSEADELKVSSSTARALWAQHEQSTRTLAATLAEQLRLILAPTLATKLRGDFRTGKRLNIKRIIPYIASSYKRDKIWMRRSVPSKRSYQIMIALDDSKSMADGEGEPGSKKELAFETLALLAKALAVLEAGELCVVGFGADVRVAHPFGKPFTDDAGAEVLQSFSFEQHKTEVRKLTSEAIELFRDARAKASGATAELWQLMLVVSDGVCEDHESIRRLTRKAQEERIMIVFVVVDRHAEDGKSQSIMDLQTAEFGTGDNGEMKLVRKKYMDTFPFRWWLVVRDVRELPGVLSTALRQWFTEVADTTG